MKHEELVNMNMKDLKARLKEIGTQAQTAQITVMRFAQCPSRCLRNASTPAMENMGRYPPMEAHFPKSEENRFGRAGTSGIRNRLNRIRQIRVRSL